MPSLFRDDRWKVASARERAQALKSLVAALGKGWKVENEETTARGQIVRVRYVPLGIVFCLVPGGRHAMGLRASDMKASKALAKGEEKELLRGRAAKPRDTVLPALLLAESPLEPAAIAALDGGAAPEIFGVPEARIAKVLKGLAKHGLRLPTADEWEAAARGGTDALFPTGRDELPTPTDDVATAFGHRRLGALAELCADERVRGGGLLSWPWQGTGEWLAMRSSSPGEPPGDFTAFRPAIGVPGALAEEDAPAVTRPRPEAPPRKTEDSVDWEALKFARGKSAKVGYALSVIADPARSEAHKDAALADLHPFVVSDGPVLTGSAAFGRVALGMLATLEGKKHRATLAGLVVDALCGADLAASALGIPSSPAHAARYGKGAGKELYAAVSAALDPALSLCDGVELVERRAGVRLLAYVSSDPARRDARLLDLARADADPWLRMLAAYALAMNAKNGGAGVADEVIDDAARALGDVAAPLVALVRLVRDGERASDAVVAACGTTKEFNLAIGAQPGHAFFFASVQGVSGATAAALKAIGPRGEKRATDIFEANAAAYRKMMGR